MECIYMTRPQWRALLVGGLSRNPNVCHPPVSYDRFTAPPHEPGPCEFTPLVRALHSHKSSKCTRLPQPCWADYPQLNGPYYWGPARGSYPAGLWQTAPPLCGRERKLCAAPGGTAPLCAAPPPSSSTGVSVYAVCHPRTRDTVIPSGKQAIPSELAT